MDPPTSRNTGVSKRKHQVAPVAPSADVMSLLVRFRVILQSTRQHYQTVEAAVGLGGAQLQALAIIADQPKIRVSAVAKAMVVRQPTASNLIEQLVRLNLVLRKRSRTDQRAIELSATAKARRLLANAPGPIVGILAEALAALSQAE